MELKEDINKTSNEILTLLKDFQKRQDYTLEINYENKQLTHKLVGYLK